MAIDKAQLKAIMSMAATNILFTCTNGKLVYSVPF